MFNKICKRRLEWGANHAFCAEAWFWHWKVFSTFSIFQRKTWINCNLYWHGNSLAGGRWFREGIDVLWLPTLIFLLWHKVFLIWDKQTSRAVCSPYGASKGEMLNMLLNKWHLHYLFMGSMLTEKMKTATPVISTKLWLFSNTIPIGRKIGSNNFGHFKALPKLSVYLVTGIVCRYMCFVFFFFFFFLICINS